MRNADHNPENSLVIWFASFLCLWQSIYKVSDKAIEVLLIFFHTFASIIVANFSTLKTIGTQLPSTVYNLRKFFYSKEDPFKKYVVCPVCFSIYEHDSMIETDDLGKEIPKKCSYIRFPNHPQMNRRIECGGSLFKTVKLQGGKRKLRARYEYAYQPLKQSLQKLLNCKGFAEKLEYWRKRSTVPGWKSDIYDGNVWKDFQTDKYGCFLQQKRCIGVMLNLDFFQPFKHVNESYGVIYLTIMNLPRGERCKQQNVLIVGIIPSFAHEPDTLNPFLEPLVGELKEFWNPGVRLHTAESPKYKLLFQSALMYVACDIPAARKCCGFKGHSANLGCSRCLKFFPGDIGNKDFSGFDRDTWPKRHLAEH